VRKTLPSTGFKSTTSGSGVEALSLNHYATSTMILIMMRMIMRTTEEDDSDSGEKRF